MPMKTDDLMAYINNPEPFSLLEIETRGKSITTLYQELHFRALEEFKEHCYRSKKNYTYSMFQHTIFHRRYRFLRHHLDKLSIWLYENENLIPEELQQAKVYKPQFINPWGVQEFTDQLCLTTVVKK